MTTPPELQPLQTPEHKGLLSLGLGFLLSTLLLLGFGVSVVLFVGAMLNHIFTPDLPWLLASGEYILRHHALPQTNLLSWSHPHQPWVLYQWLFEVGLAWKSHVYGLPMVLRGSIVWAVMLYAIWPLLRGRMQRVPLVWTLLSVSLALLAITINLSLRPMIVTAFFLAVQVALLSQFRQSPRTRRYWGFWVAWALMYLLWGNMHTGVVLGLLSLVLFLLGDSMECLGLYRFEPPAPVAAEKPLGIRPWLLLLAVAVGASLVNPYGWGIYSYLYTLSGQGYLNASIIELQSPDFHQGAYQVFLLLVGLFLVLLPRIRRVMPAGEVLNLVVFTLATLFVQRFVVWACLFYVLFLPQALAWRWQGLARSEHHPFTRWMRRFDVFRLALMAGLLLMGAIFLLAPRWLKAPPVRMGSCELLRPGIEAAYRLHQPKDKVFQDPETGSCSLFYHPEMPVFIDTRFDVYGAAFMRETRETLAMARDPRPVLQRWDINLVVIRRKFPLYTYLKAQPDFVPAYADAHMVVLRRRL